MTQVNLNTTVGNWVARYPQTSRVFESFEIDYCCGGGKSLEQACWDRQLDPQHVLQQIEQAINGGDEPTEDWLNAPLAKLCDHIEQTHHTYLKSELPRLTEIISKVVDAHGESHPELARLQEVFAALRAELEPHMFKEERVLFPAIRQMEHSGANASFPFGSVANPIGVMEHEHDNAGNALSKIRDLTNKYEIPADACNTYRAMLDGLRELESNMHQHVHKENNILFPRAIELEEARAGV
ncbi:MAG: iron-sulfur cluster repair di-iron protein [Planctomycetota bacterium]|nr:MAG: iron-sulfur cluster repair di-iron protein [Planctomycetota bacterium]REJ92146.1 MAG: iron-sulfur cluster repair di-iron protein [Planctomycetota bacterium]REK28682.1 MAG: iron-sulfur cluster repair di-iron protein [Planctomycetota bacterium]REK39296.1 MAG: iron-sulfur cluster repair di-iron protein [Planctomycetota bacterium]